MKAVKPMTITVVYDNNTYDPRLQRAWGFACLVERGETTILFDTGGDGTLLLSNMDSLGFDPADLDIVLLSHIHGDHTGGLGTLLATGIRPMVYLPSSFPADFKTQIRAQTDLVEVNQVVEIIEGVYTTGQMGSGIIEHALILKTTEGLVVVTGCAHPGIVEMVRQAKAVGGDELYLVLGGFHLGSASKAQVKEIISDFRWLGVQNVAPCHCTGDQATDLFHQDYGDRFVRSGVGKVLVFDGQN
jgi:7,8-dihydropterin-6-yl-methyl-4-(beta-D-ribofuranosyl)aminobenzene 5'-phosphate synthase